MIPAGIVTTGWPAVEARCAEWGDEFDEWQRGLGRVMLGKRESGEYAATVGGITLSIPRQVAKTFIVGRTVFAMASLFPGMKILWTAHRARTATNTFRSLEGFAKRKAVAGHIAPGRRDGMGILAANGEQEIPFRNGSIIMFGARETGFGRGFDEVDVIVFDEAQILTERALEDMVATTNQSPHPHGALLFFMGTPPRPVDPGEAFTLRRAEALAGEMVDGVYIECSADRGCDPDDREQWAQANPSYPHRTPERSLLRLRKNLPSDESWLREALGIWDDDALGPLFDMGEWRSMLLPGNVADRPSPVAISVAVSQDRKWSSIGLAGVRGDDRHVAVVKSARGTEWVPFEVSRLIDEWSPVGVAISPSSPAGSLIPSIETIPKVKSKRCRLVAIGARDDAQATGMLVDRFRTGTLTHQGQKVLDVAVEHAELRTSGQTETIDHRTPGVDVSPLQGVSWALFALESLKAKGRAGAVRGAGRR